MRIAALSMLPFVNMGSSVIEIDMNFDEYVEEKFQENLVLAKEEMEFNPESSKEKIEQSYIQSAINWTIEDISDKVRACFDKKLS